ncbi:MAG: DUF1501 domain-containing protein [Anaerolineae bacterium]|nr:DUF1501 domain-containing protein [Anaerolineae bacterium]
MTKTSRRGFMVGCSSAIAAMAGARLNFAAFANPELEPNQEIMVVIFLRGACDVINFIPPIGGIDRGHYETARPDLLIPTVGVDAALPLGLHPFGLHPAAASLHDLYQDGKLAIVQATGMHEDTRSHFDAMAFMELGTPGSKSSSSGWLSRHLSSAQNLPPTMIMPAMAMGNLQPTSLIGNYDTVGMSSPGSFNLSTGPYSWRSAQRLALRQLYELGASDLHLSGVQALNAADIVEANYNSSYVPENGAVYPDNSFGDQLENIAQMVKLQLGLQLATVDLGGWDTHESQSDYGNGATGYFAGLVQTLSDGLAALYLDLDSGYTQRLTVVVMSEFGRRLRGNDDRGTDHGHGSMMLVMSGNAIGGLHGTWPGLHQDQLYDRNDLAVTTDYRQILSEILIRRMGNPQLGTVFPGYQNYTPLGVVQGKDLEPIYTGAHSVYLPTIMR